MIKGYQCVVLDKDGLIKLIKEHTNETDVKLTGYWNKEHTGFESIQIYSNILADKFPKHSFIDSEDDSTCIDIQLEDEFWFDLFKELGFETASIRIQSDKENMFKLYAITEIIE